jgi:peptide/nickel transport system substrate-binding protein
MSRKPRRILPKASRAKAIRAKASLAATSALLLLACTTPPADTSSELVVALENAPLNLDPRIGTDQASSRVFELMLNGLVAKDPQGNLLPALASSWEILDGGRLYRFHLRDDVTFHDGRPFGAEDVVWTFQSILDGTVVTAKRGAFELLERVESPEPGVVDFVMREPFGAMLVNLTSYMGIVPRGVLPDEQNASPVGTGPFRVVDRRTDGVTLEAYSEAWEGVPSMERIVLRQVPDPTVRALELRKGSVQLVVNGLAPDVVPDFRADPDFRVVEDPGSNYVYLGLNLEDRILSRVEVRQAMARAFDRERLVESLYRGLGVVTETVMPPGHWARNDEIEPIPYDPAGARERLDRAGFPDPDGNGPATRFDLTYKTSTDETALLQAQILQAMLADVGIGIDIRSYEFATFYNDIKQGNFQVFSLTWTGIVDPDFYALILHSGRVPPDGANRGRYRNDEFDRLVDAGAREVLLEKRRPYYLRAQEILAEELPYISLLTKVNVAVMPRRLEGYRNYLSGELYSLKQVRWSSPPEP